MGLIEYAVQTAGMPGLPYVSLDHLFYLAWNLVSMSAAIRILKPGCPGLPGLLLSRRLVSGFHVVSPMKSNLGIRSGRGLGMIQIT